VSTFVGITHVEQVTRCNVLACGALHMNNARPFLLKQKACGTSLVARLSMAISVNLHGVLSFCVIAYMLVLDQLAAGCGIAATASRAGLRRLDCVSWLV
jgi:hypothetical protein